MRLTSVSTSLGCCSLSIVLPLKHVRHGEYILNSDSKGFRANLTHPPAYDYSRVDIPLVCRTRAFTAGRAAILSL